MRKTKIVGTIGPASDSEEMLRKLFEAGLNVCRLNFSHGSHEEHLKRINLIKKVREDMGLPIAIMLDTKGPEIRIGKFQHPNGIELKSGEFFTLTTREIAGNQQAVSVSYKNLPRDIKSGDIILLDDGLIALKVLEMEETEIECVTLNGGQLKDHKGVNIPNIKINMPAITQKDRDDIFFGIENDIDFIAASFVRKAEDVLAIKSFLEENHGEKIEIIAKIENQEGIENLDEIIRVSDGIMVARGDLGVEINPEEVPVIQKLIIRKCNEADKPVITATQMLDSMMRNPRPTRAEVTDVANAIYDGTSAIMLSGETAAGLYPYESVSAMNAIAISIEDSLDYAMLLKQSSSCPQLTITDSIGKSVTNLAEDLGVKAILTPTSSGYTAKVISKFKPRVPVIAATTDEKVRRKLSLVWGVYPILYFSSMDDVIQPSILSAIKEGYINEDDLIVITAGVPVGITGSTNLITVRKAA